MYPGSSDSKASAYNVGDLGSMPGSGRSLGEVATHSSTLAWKIPWTEKPGRLQPMGSQRIGHDFTFTFLSHLFLLLYLLPSETDPQNIAMFYAKESSAYILF